MSEMSYYVLDENDCKHISLTKEQIYAAITEAIETGTITDVDTGFVTKIKEMNADKLLSFWIGSSAQYNTLTAKDPNTLYILTDESTLGDAMEKVDTLESNVAALNETVNNSMSKRTVIYDNAEGIQLVEGERKDIVTYYDMIENLEGKIAEVEWIEKYNMTSLGAVSIQNGIVKFRLIRTENYYTTSNISFLCYTNDETPGFLTVTASTFGGSPQYNRVEFKAEVSKNGPFYGTYNTNGIYITKITLIDE